MSCGVRPKEDGLQPIGGILQVCEREETLGLTASFLRFSNVTCFVLVFRDLRLTVNCNPNVRDRILSEEMGWMSRGRNVDGRDR